MAPGDRLTYTHGSGWQTINNTGTVKSAGATGATGAQGSIGPSMAWGGNEVEVDEGLSITYSNAGNPSISSTLKAFLARQHQQTCYLPSRQNRQRWRSCLCDKPDADHADHQHAASVGGTWTAATWIAPAFLHWAAW